MNKREVIISIKPTWCKLIANGEKVYEIRKRAPKEETPFKAYILLDEEHFRSAAVYGTSYRYKDIQMQWPYNRRVHL